MFTRTHDSRLSSLAQLSAMAEKTAKAFAERGSQLVGVLLCLDAYLWHVERHRTGFKTVTYSLCNFIAAGKREGRL